MIRFWVSGTPVPKQSFRYKPGSGGFVNYIPARVKEWAELVAISAKMSMQGMDILSGDLKVILHFAMPTHRKVDVDNLSKNLLDSAKGIIFDDDRQVTYLTITKCVSKDPGVEIIVEETEMIYEPNRL